MTSAQAVHEYARHIGTYRGMIDGDLNLLKDIRQRMLTEIGFGYFISRIERLIEYDERRLAELDHEFKSISGSTNDL